ncbi:MAG TPA: hypothetical protein VHU80_19780 [Polyangiaceae bacterium]|jgi:hypothetical protein|nr:hypothetical protein [Polyangiaceae bacterium]
MAAALSKGSLLALAAFTAFGCAAAVESTKVEDRARRTVPIPICLKPLPRHASAGVVATLTPEDYWSLILPAYDAQEGTVDPNGSDCAGGAIFAAPELSEAEGPRTTINVTPTELTVAKGPDGFQVVWLRSHRFANGTSAGPLALMRPREAYAEAYAIGLYRGSPDTSKLGYQRLGADILITAANERCAGAAAGQDCDSDVQLYLARDGALKPAGTVDVERVHYGSMPSVAGTVQYRLSATPKYKERSIVVTEQLVLRDSEQNEIRRASQDRTWTLSGDGKLVADADSLWARMVTPKATPAQAPAAASSAGAPPQKPHK